MLIRRFPLDLPIATLGIWLGLIAPMPAEAQLMAAERPQAPTPRSVTDNIGKVTVQDNYRWMENDPPPPEMTAFLHASTEQTHALLARIPGRERMVATISALDTRGPAISAMTPEYDTLYYLRRGAADDVARLVTRRASGGAERVLIDPEALSDATPHSEIDQFSPSPNGSYIAYGLEYAGPDTSTLRIYDAVRNTTLAERIPDARFAQVTWSRESDAFYYTRPVVPPGTAGKTVAPATPGKAPAQLEARRWSHLGVYMHKLGKAVEEDVQVLDGARLPFATTGAGAIPSLLIPPESDHALAIVSDGITPNLTLAAVPLAQLAQHPAPWQLMAGPADGVAQVSVSGEFAFMLTSAGAPRLRVVTEDLTQPGFANARTVLPQSVEGDGVLTGIAAAKDALYAARREGAAMHLLRLDYGRSEPEEVRLPYAGTIAPVFGIGTAHAWGGLVADGRMTGAFFSLESWAHPLTWMRFDLQLRRALDMGLLPEPAIDPALYKTIETTAPADDGTAIPLSIVSRQDVAMDHSRPTLVDAYGSFGYPFDPRFMPMALAWADRGGVFAVAHVRGGGELGQAWHEAGTMARKKVAATDMIACARALIKMGYTDRAHLAGMGTNAGALAIGNAITLQPDLFRAALLNAGLDNPLRVEEAPGHDVDVLELGSVHIPLQQAAVLSIDPYAQIKDGLAYPAVLLTSATNDAYEPSWQTAKMAARLQAASTSSRPILLRSAFDRSRDGPTRPQRDEEQADDLSFFLWQLGAPGFQPARAVERKAKGFGPSTRSRSTR